MAKRRFFRFFLGFLLLAFVPGCGGCGVSGRGKNSDFDRPKMPEKQAEKPGEKK